MSIFQAFVIAFKRPSYLYSWLKLKFLHLYPFSLLYCRLKQISPSTGSDLYCIYDLDCSCISFNILDYLCAYSYESELRKTNFHLVVLDEYHYKSYDYTSFRKAYSIQNRDYRSMHLILQSTRLFPRCTGYTFLSDRDNFSRLFNSSCIFPSNYSPFLPGSGSIDTCANYKHLGPLFSAIDISPFALTLVKKYLPASLNKSIVTITLRCSDFDPPRNSILKEWSIFCEYLEDEGYLVVVIPDSENPSLTYPINEKYIYDLFSANVELRAALYQLSFCNLGSPCGPMLLSAYNPSARSTILLNSLPEGSETLTPEAYAQQGLEPGSDYFFFNSSSTNSKLPETFANMKHLFLQSFI